MHTTENDKEFRKFIYDRQKSRFELCLYPGTTWCTQEVINAHSIQNHGVLENLVEDGHVAVIGMRHNLDKGPQPEFQLLGRHRATTFSGLCGPHDHQLFEPIDTAPFDPLREDHKFLLAYRSILREAHAQCRAARLIQSTYSKGVDLRRFDPNTPDEPMTKATTAMLESWCFFRHLCSYHDAYCSNQLSAIEHHVLTVSDSPGQFAVSGAYALIDNMSRAEDRLDYKCAALNLFPSGGQTICVLSYPASHRSHWLGQINEMHATAGEYRKYYFSKLVLQHCENTVFAPSYVAALSEAKRASLLKYFAATMSPQKQDYEDENLYLF
ncbi:MAG: hypothetical protein ACKVWV_07515 [Planctomycetota bacterium]